MKITNSGNPRAPFEVSYIDEDKKRKKRRFASRLDAEAFIAELETRQKLPSELRFNTSDRIIFSQIKELCASKGVALADAYKFLALKIGEICPVKTVTIAEALPSYIRAITAARGLAANTLRFYEQCITTFFKANGFATISDVAKCNIASAFTKVKSPTHVKRALNPFFNWCVEQGYATSNPIASAKPLAKLVVRKIPTVLSLDQTKRLFAVLPRAWRPAFALWAFVGLRPSEITDASRGGIKVSNIDFENKRITVDVGKMRRHPRIIVNAPANVWQWLAPLKKLRPTDAVAPESYQCYINLMRKLPFDIPQDTLRHTFGTNSFFHFGEALTKDVMGHGKNTDTLFTYYKGLGTPAAAKQYFSITPMTVEKWAKTQPPETVPPIVKRVRKQSAPNLRY